MITELSKVVPLENVRRELDELYAMARTMGADAGFHNLPDEFGKKVEPRLRLLREQLFYDSSEAAEARRSRIGELEAELEQSGRTIAEFLSGAREEKEASALGHRWQAFATIAGSALLLGLCLEEFGGIPVPPRLAVILGIAAALAILNFESVLRIPGSSAGRWRRWRNYRRAIARSRAHRRELEDLRRLDLERGWVHKWAEQLMTGARQGLDVEYQYSLKRAAAARQNA